MEPRIGTPGDSGPNGGATSGIAHNREISLIGAEIVITGNIRAAVELHVHGKVVGDVSCATLILGEGSSVNGGIYATRVKVFGSVEGVIETRDLAIEGNGRVFGDITYERLRVADGGVIQGSVNTRAAGALPQNKQIAEAGPSLAQGRSQEGKTKGKPGKGNKGER